MSDDSKKYSTLLSGSDWPKNPDGTVDIDRAAPKMLFVCASKAALEPVCNFLNRRGWKSAMASKLNEAFRQIGSLQPDFILLSINFRSPKLKQLPSLFNDMFKCTVVAFAEKADTKSLNELQKLSAEFKIHGPISGPNLQVRMRKILQAIFQPESAGTKTINTPLTRGPNTNPGYKARSGLDGSGPSDPDGGDFSIDLQSDKEGKGAFILNKRVSKNESRPPLTLEEMDHLALEFSHDNQKEDESSMQPDDGGAPSNIIAEEDERTSFDSGHSRSGFFQLNKNEFGPDLQNGQGLNQELKLKSNNESQIITTGQTETLFRLRKESDVTRSGNPSLGDQTQEYIRTQSWTQVLERLLADALPLGARAENNPGHLRRCLIQTINCDANNSFLVLNSNLSEQDANVFEGEFKKLLEVVGKKYFDLFEIKYCGHIQIPRMKANITLSNEVADVSFGKDGGITLNVKHVIPKENDFDLKMDPVLGKITVSPEWLVPDTSVGASLFLYLPLNKKFYHYVGPHASLTDTQIEKLLIKKTLLYLEPADQSLFESTLERMKIMKEYFVQKSPREKTA